MKKITLISQNLYNCPKLNEFTPEKYIKSYKADYYAFQEYPGNKTRFCTMIVNKDNQLISSGTEAASTIWNSDFPWMDFRDGYWSEAQLEIENIKIHIINIHIGPYYTQMLRCVLIKRLHQLKDSNVILVGDFNAAFSYQTEKAIKDHEVFLNCLLSQGYTELESEEEKKGSTHYTYVDIKKSGLERKKLDHVFIAKSIEYDERLNVELEKYIDEANINRQLLSGITGNGFSDHTGIKICITLV